MDLWWFGLAGFLPDLACVPWCYWFLGLSAVGVGAALSSGLVVCGGLRLVSFWVL